jgi:hypothetical protein
VGQVHPGDLFANELSKAAGDGKFLHGGTSGPVAGARARRAKRAPTMRAEKPGKQSVCRIIQSHFVNLAGENLSIDR